MRISYLTILASAALFACQSNQSLQLVSPDSIYQADGRTIIKIQAIPEQPKLKWQIYPADSLVSVVDSSDSVLLLKVGFTSGELQIYANTDSLHDTIHLTLLADSTDIDKDGFPDVSELNSNLDRALFRQWFVWIALQQKTKMMDSWPISERDCAGLIRFCTKEALKSHDPKWLAQHPIFITPPPSKDVSKFRYPNIPIIGTNIFLVDDSIGSSDYADAKTLLELNTDLIAIDLNPLVQPADLLFYVIPEADTVNYHSMIFLGGAENSIIYHTGIDTIGIKLVTIAELSKHPDKKWHPASSNPFFKGYYRLKFID